MARLPPYEFEGAIYDVVLCLSVKQIEPST